jgi:hypothetical protein
MGALLKKIKKCVYPHYTSKIPINILTKFQKNGAIGNAIIFITQLYLYEYRCVNLELLFLDQNDQCQI